MANSVKLVKDIFSKLTSDEVFCRLVYYGENALDVNREDISTNPSCESMMKERIKITQQVDDIVTVENVMIFIFKSFTKLRNETSAVRSNLIQIDLFVPHQLVESEYRIYELQDKVDALLDNANFGINRLSYIDGHFVMSPIRGYSTYRMIFSLEEGRSFNGRY